MRKESGPKEEMRSGKGKRQREGDHSGEHFGAMSSPSFASFYYQNQKLRGCMPRFLILFCQNKEVGG